jgi:hypothetical protein
VDGDNGGQEQTGRHKPGAMVTRFWWQRKGREEPEKREGESKKALADRRRRQDLCDTRKQVGWDEWPC